MQLELQLDLYHYSVLHWVQRNRYSSTSSAFGLACLVWPIVTHPVGCSWANKPKDRHWESVVVPLWGAIVSASNDGNAFSARRSYRTLHGELTSNHPMVEHEIAQVWHEWEGLRANARKTAWAQVKCVKPVGKHMMALFEAVRSRSLSSFSSSSTPFFNAIGDDMQWHGWNSETLGICTLKGSTPSPAVIKSPSIRLWRCLALSWSRKCLQPSWINKSGDEKKDLSNIMFYDMMCPTSWVAKPAFVSKWSGDSLRPIFRVTRPACNPSNLILTTVTKRRCSKQKIIEKPAAAAAAATANAPPGAPGKIM